jgi:hypothetical protein
MKNLFLMLASMAAVSVASAQTMTVTWADNHSPDAGEFILTPDNGTAFPTYCVELNQYVTIGGTYSYLVSGSSDGGVNGPQPVTMGSAWLYSQFRAGALPGWDNSQTDQIDLQNAVWFFQGEIPSSAGSEYAKLAINDLGGMAEAFAPSAGAYGVDIWNLFDANGNECQSQLGMVPEPAAVELLKVGGFLWIGMLIIRRLK